MPQTRKYGDNAQRQAAYRRRRSQSRADERSAELPAHVRAGTTTEEKMSEEKRWRTRLLKAFQSVATTCQEMEERYLHRSERWQESERGEEFQERLDTVHEALEALEALVETGPRQPERYRPM